MGRWRGLIRSRFPITSTVSTVPRGVAARHTTPRISSRDLARVLARPRLLARRRAARGARGGASSRYLMRVFRNTFLNSRRTASRRPQVSATLEQIEASDPRSTQQPETANEIAEVYAAIAALPDDFRLALVAVDIIGLSYAQAGRALGAPEATITSRLHRARRRVVASIDGADAAVSGRRKDQCSRGVLIRCTTCRTSWTTRPRSRAGSARRPTSSGSVRCCAPSPCRHRRRFSRGSPRWPGTSARAVHALTRARRLARRRRRDRSRAVGRSGGPDGAANLPDRARAPDRSGAGGAGRSGHADRLPAVGGARLAERRRAQTGSTGAR